MIYINGSANKIYGRYWLQEINQQNKDGWWWRWLRGITIIEGGVGVVIVDFFDL